MLENGSSFVCLIVVAACGVLGSACGPGRVPSTEQQVKASLDLHAAAGPVRIRFNPVPCDCPPFEVLTGSTWLRVQVTGSSLTDLPLEDVPGSFQADDGAATPAEQRFFVKMSSGRILRCSNRTPYFEITLVGREPPKEALP
jgi:hypothetical protein